MPSPPQKVAVCGGTVSGVTLARLLATCHTIDLYRHMFDPARSIHKPHPLCEYAPATFVIPDSSSKAVREEINRWIDLNLITPSKSDKFRISRYTSESGLFGKINDPSPSPPSSSLTSSSPSSSSRYYPKRGLFSVIEKLISSLKKDRHVTVRDEQLCKSEKREDGWYVTDCDSKIHGPYDYLIYSFDYLPRAARKASIKQMLEAGLPESQRIIGSAAGSVAASAMTVVATFHPPIDDHDSIRICGIPELAVAARGNTGDEKQRGLKTLRGNSTWTLIATPEWSMKIKESTAKGKGGRGWDKRGVGNKIIQAFGKVVNRPNLINEYRLVVPTFHWQGCSSQTEIKEDKPAFAYDAEARLAICGDMFGGQGVAGALRSAFQLADVLLSQDNYKNSNNGDGYDSKMISSQIPEKTDWVLRCATSDDDDTMAIVGGTTGRRRRREDHTSLLLDDTWPTAVQIANGMDIQKADSLKKYRRRKNNNNNYKSRGGQRKSQNHLTGRSDVHHFRGGKRGSAGVDVRAAIGKEEGGGEMAARTSRGRKLAGGKFNRWNRYYGSRRKRRQQQEE